MAAPERKDPDGCTRRRELQQLVLQSSQAIFSWSEEDGIHSWNQGAQKLYGYSAAEALGRPVEALLHPVDGASPDGVLTALRQEGHWMGEVQHTTRDGQVVMVNSRQERIWVRHGERFLAMNEPLAVLPAAGERPLELSRLVQAGHDAVFSWTGDGVIRTWNTGAAQLYGFTAEEALGRISHDLLRTRHPGSWQAIAGQLETVGEWTGYLDHVTKAGRSITVSSRLQVIEVGGEQVTLEINRDMTRDLKVERELQRQAAISQYAEELEQANLELRDREQQLLRTNEQLEQFAYIASHDLRSPLRGISQAVGFIREDDGGGLSDNSLGYLDRLDQRVERMSRLLDDLLVYSRIGRKSGRITAVPLAELIREVVDMTDAPEAFRFSLPERALVFRTHIAPLRQVLLNLIGNAVHHHDRPDGHVAVIVDRRGGRLRIQVSDDGPGIPEAYHEKVFQMFQTLHPKSRGGGSGLGLAIVRRIVEHFGGTISLRSHPGQGAAFTFTWPVDPPPLPEEDELEEEG